MCTVAHTRSGRTGASFPQSFTGVAKRHCAVAARARARYPAAVSHEALPLWTRSLAWSAAYVGFTARELVDGLAPELREPFATLLSSIPSGDATARARALGAARRQWLRSSGAPVDDELVTRLGARVIASLVASTPASARAALARSFEANSLRLAAVEARNARSCASVSLQPMIDAIARATSAPPTALVVGAVALASLTGDTAAPRVAHDALRSLRAQGIDVRTALAPFADDARALLAEGAR
jgi:hypothetical protein